MIIVKNSPHVYPNHLYLTLLFIIISAFSHNLRQNAILCAPVKCLDYYPNLTKLKQSEIYGKAFKIIIKNRQSPVTIIAPHGGLIEPGTSKLAQAIAGHQYNLYDFEGLLKTNNTKLHVTATHFRDPDLIQLLKKSQFAISIHSYGTEDSKVIWLGGLNLSLKELIKQNLIKAGFSVNDNSPRYKGISPKNIVNKTPNFGCQIELPKDLLDSMYVGQHKFSKNGFIMANIVFHKFVKAVRKAIKVELH